MYYNDALHLLRENPPPSIIYPIPVLAKKTAESAKGNLTPRPLTEPTVTVSRHTASAILDKDLTLTYLPVIKEFRVFPFYHLEFCQRLSGVCLVLFLAVSVLQLTETSRHKQRSQRQIKKTFVSLKYLGVLIDFRIYMILNFLKCIYKQ